MEMKPYVNATTDEKSRVQSIFDQYPLLITIDGPSGVGKTTVSKKLSGKLGYRYLDTGALYRGVALLAKRSKISLGDEKALSSMLGRMVCSISNRDDQFILMINGEDVTEKLRTAEISMLASEISAKPMVREFLLDIQRQMGNKKKMIAEGRDMGTVVFPNADIKFYLDAPVHIRAKRRFQDASHKTDQSFEQVQSDLKKRDHNDSERIVAPLKPAKDAVIIDSSKMAIDQVIDMMVKAAKKKCV